MKLFGQLVRTAVNVVTLPVDVARDVADPFVNAEFPRRTSHTSLALDRIKREAEERKREPR
jgi:hypothetical protein